MDNLGLLANGFSENLATQRAQYLSALLTPALAFGTSDPSTGEPLKVDIRNRDDSC
jgi:hypothetical protein